MNAEKEVEETTRAIICKDKCIPHVLVSKVSVYDAHK